MCLKSLKIFKNYQTGLIENLNFKFLLVTEDQHQVPTKNVINYSELQFSSHGVKV